MAAVFPETENTIISVVHKAEHCKYEKILKTHYFRIAFSVC